MSVPNEYMHDEMQSSFFKQLNLFDWIFAVLLVAGSIFAYQKYSHLMDGYEVGILFFTAASLIALGWLWKPMRALMFYIAVLSLFAINLYGADLAAAENNFFLKYLFSGQSATMWMSALFVMATMAYFIELFTGNAFTGKVAVAMTWSATAMGFIGLLVRWRETYLHGADIGYIPVSNLYEVFILFAIITALIYLYYEKKYETRSMGAFVLLVITAAIAFLLWYHFERDAAEIKPLVPALQSYWMKIHVPANFVGYGAFALAAMIGVAYLIKDSVVKRNPNGLVASRLPSLDMMDDVMHKSIALGFAFFTIATVLGAMWAAEAWGGYWSWDPKETWALIVWLNYAAWLHMRLMKGLRGPILAWWAVIGLFVTLFAFVGVNMFLSGLHSYGEL
ncbi:MAG: c-type cytochrome biogenesis protein CcsB [Gammaproteobacteria bacterium]|nr:c-type cytochrome biogenesis protein CcsB [Gammaproteobacteria bacterium]